MQTYHLFRCGDLNIQLPLGIVEMGFQPDSTYCLYFLDNGRDTPEANMLELVLLPFQWPTLGELYSIRLQLRNVPHATWHAVHVLSAHGIDIKTTSAIDCIAGNIGSIDAVIRSRLGLQEIDDAFATAFGTPDDRTKLFVEQVRDRSMTDPDGRFFGRFVTGIRFSEAYPQFAEHIAPTHPLVDGKPTKLKQTGAQLEIALPPEIGAYVNHTYGRADASDLRGYPAALTVNTEFNRISISFLNPNEVLMLLTLIIDDHPGTFEIISDLLGSMQVNFRIVYIKNLVPGQRARIELLCDISRTEFPIMSMPTMRRVLWNELRSRLRSAPGLTSELVHQCEVRAEYGYPRKTRNFGPRDHFHLIDIYLIRRPHQGEIPNECRWSRLFDDVRDTTCENYCLELADVLFSGQPFATTVRTTRAPTRDDGAAMPTILDHEAEGECQGFVVHADSRQYWVLHHTAKVDALRDSHDSVVACAFDNVPPFNLSQKFFHGLAADVHTSLSNKRFGDLVKQFLRGLSYGFPKQAEFLGFGDLPSSRFLETAITRFAALSDVYILEKWAIDGFPIEGNLRLSEYLEEYVEERYVGRDDVRRHGPIRIVDLGCAGGALTALFALRVFQRHGLLEYVHLTLVDISKRTLEATKNSTFALPGELFKEHLSPLDESICREKLKTAETVEADLTDPAGLAGPFDIVLSGFTHHHLNNEGRKKASERMCRIVEEGGFVGLVDECLGYDQYLAYLTDHIRDDVRPALESFLPDVREHMRFFEDEGIAIRDYQHAREDRYYCFWGVRPTGAIRKPSVEGSPVELGSAVRRLTERVEIGFKEQRESALKAMGRIDELGQRVTAHLSHSKRQQLEQMLLALDRERMDRQLVVKLNEGFDELSKRVGSLQMEQAEQFRAVIETARSLGEDGLIDSKLKLQLSCFFLAFETNLDILEALRRIRPKVSEKSREVIERGLEAYREIRRRLEKT